MKLKTQEKGITLIALVIMIIVLLILAGISIAMLVGDNGILTKAASAKVKTEIATEKEFISLSVTQARAEDEKRKLKYDLFNTALNSIIKDGAGREYELNPKRDSAIYKIKYLDSNRCYEVTNNGIISEISIEEFEDISTIAVELSLKIKANSVNEYNGKLQGEVFFTIEGQDNSDNMIWSELEKVKIDKPGDSTNNIILSIPNNVNKVKVTPIQAVSGSISGEPQEISLDSGEIEASYIFESSEDFKITNSVTVVYDK